METEQQNNDLDPRIQVMKKRKTQHSKYVKYTIKHSIKMSKNIVRHSQ